MLAKMVTPLLLVLCADPVVLDNGALRVEIDPQVFSIRFVGLPGGQNFLEPLLLEPEDRDSRAWLDPGGLVSDLIPLDTQDGALRRGPAEVVAQDGLSVILLGPKSAKAEARLKKEVRLDPEKPEAVFKVTVLSAQPSERRFAVRNTARVPRDSSLRVLKSEGGVRVLSSEEQTLQPAVTKSNDYWLIPVPPTSPAKGLVLGAFVERVATARDDGVWTRRIAVMPEDRALVPHESTFMAILDDPSVSYGSALQSAKGPISIARPMVYTEHWTFDKRGR